jgi:uncharacterized membrane protein
VGAAVLAVLIGVVAGLRAMTAPAAVAWGARLGMIRVSGTALAWLAHPWTAWVFTLLAVGELVTDQLPTTPSRTVPVQFGTRLLMGALCGGAACLPALAWQVGAGMGVVGAVIGTLGGRAARARLARAFGSDRPAALLEDAVAIGLAALVVLLAR